MNKMLKMDEMFLRLSIPLPPEQDSGLERSLMREGCKEPITTWNGVIIDGHKRYRFCMEEGIEFDVEEMRFSSAEEAVETWEGETNSLSGNMLMAIARIIVAYGDSLKEDVFKDHVGKVSVKSIIRTAKERRPGAMGFAEAMMIRYNLKNKHRLSLRTLYGGKNVTFEDEEEIPESGEDG